MDNNTTLTPEEDIKIYNFTIEEEDEEEEDNSDDSQDDAGSESDDSQDDSDDGDESEEDNSDDSQDDEVTIDEPSARSTDDEDEKDDAEGEGDEDIDDEDEKAISKVVDKRLKEVNKKLTQIDKLRDETEVNAFIQTQPEYAKYKTPALKYMAHPAYKNIPVDNIMAMLSAKDAMKIGAQKERETQKKVKDTQTKNSQTRKESGGKPDYKNMPTEEFNRVKQEALNKL